MAKSKNTDTIRAKGTVTLLQKDADGNIIKEETIKNLIVNSGRNALAALLGGAGGSDKVVTQISFGTNGASPVGGDVAPLTDNFDKVLDGESYDGVNMSVTFEGSLGTGENNGVTIREFGLLCDDGTLFSRISYAGIAKTNLISLEITWKIEF